MGSKKFHELGSKSVTTDDFFVGTRQNTDGTYSDFKYSAADVISGASKKKITVASINIDGSGGLIDSFFSNTIQEIVLAGQTYIEGIDFTQSGTIITPISFSFEDTQVLIAKI